MSEIKKRNIKISHEGSKTLGPQNSDWLPVTFASRVNKNILNLPQHPRTSKEKGLKKTYVRENNGTGRCNELEENITVRKFVKWKC